MSIFDYFRPHRRNSASLAKERLQIIVSHERATRNGPDFLPKLQEELVGVIAKYVDIDEEQVKVALEQRDEFSVLELNITLPDCEQARKRQVENAVA